MKKFKKFDLVYESALKDLSIIKEESAIDSKVYSNGMKIGMSFRLKPSFFTKSKAASVMDDTQLEALKEINDRDYEKCKHYFKIKSSNREMVGPNVKTANDNNSINIEYGIISAAEKYNEIYKFILPSSDIKHIDFCNWGNNLPPVLAPKSKYSNHNINDGMPSPVKDTSFVGLGNSPTNRSLPTQNTKL